MKRDEIVVCIMKTRRPRQEQILREHHKYRVRVKCGARCRGKGMRCTTGKLASKSEGGKVKVGF